MKSFNRCIARLEDAKQRLSIAHEQAELAHPHLHNIPMSEEQFEEATRLYAEMIEKSKAALLVLDAHISKLECENLFYSDIELQNSIRSVDRLLEFVDKLIDIHISLKSGVDQHTDDSSHLRVIEGGKGRLNS